MSDFCWPVKVYYEDTDASGVVYHARYLHFLERARTEWLLSRGILQTELSRDHGIVFAISTLDINFLGPARYEDELLVSVALRKIGRVSMRVEQYIVDKDSGTRLIEANARVASLGKDSFRPLAMPKEICALISGA